MSTSKTRTSGGGHRLRLALYALVVLVLGAVAVIGLAGPSPSADNGLTKASLTTFAPLIIAPIADQSSSTGVPVLPVSPTATFRQAAQALVVTWTADGLPPGLAISSVSGLIGGTPTGTGTYYVTVSATIDTQPPTSASQSLDWYVRDTAPQVVQVVPSDGAGGTRVLIAGKNLLHTTSVHFGTVAATDVTVEKSGTTIITHAPTQMAGVVDVTVTSAGGTSSPVTADRFTYLAPSITSVSNRFGSTTGGTRVRIVGVGLAGATAVRFGGVESKDFVVRLTGNLLTAVAPAGTAGTVQIDVVTPEGVASTAGRSGFTYEVHVKSARTRHRKK